MSTDHRHLRRAALARPHRDLHRPEAPARRRCGRVPSRSTAASTPPRRACTSATWCSCSPLRRLQLAGHRPLALVGGATGLIGDPKPTAERTLNAADGRGRLGRADPRRRSSRSSTSTATTPARVVNNLDWTAPMSAHRLPARHRQALPGQPDARQGGGPRPAGLASGHQLHRVQLPDPAGHGLPGAVPAARLHAADRRQRPVGQPHRRAST